MKNNTILFCLLTWVVLQACSEDKMLVYNAADGIQFTDKTAITVRHSKFETVGNVVVTNFGLQSMGDLLVVDTFVVYAQLQGKLSDMPRFVKLKAEAIDDKTPMPEITFLDRYEIAGASDLGQFQFYIKRPAKQKEVYKTKILFDVEGTDFVKGVDELQTLELHVKDEVTLELMGGKKTEWELMEEETLGKLSVRKLGVLITVMKTSDWGAMKPLLDAWDNTTLMSIYYYVKNYNDAHPEKPMVDEDGDPITFPWFEIIEGMPATDEEQ